MTHPVADIQFRDYIGIAKRRKFIIGAILLLVVGAAVLVSALETPTYKATARVRVGATSTNVLERNANLSANVRDRTLQNEIDFARSDRVNDAASITLERPIDVSVSSASGSDTLIFSVVDTDADRAAQIANIFANAYVTERSLTSDEGYLNATTVISERLAKIGSERNELLTRLATNEDANLQIQLTALESEETRLRSQLNETDILRQISEGAAVSVLNTAEAPDAPFAPSWPRNIGLALITALFLSIGAALLIETLDDTIVSRRDLERATDGAQVLAVVPKPWLTRRDKKNVRLITTRTGPFTEAFRSLRSAIELGQASDDSIRSILVTSANASEGKSVLTAHLAISFARSGANVLVIDADMHNPTQHKLFDVSNKNGLADYLANIGEAETVIERASGEGLLSLIPAGISASPPAELLSSDAVRELFDKLSYAFDLVIIDSPPLLPVADTPPLARMTDATILVAMRGTSRDRDVKQATDLLASTQTRPFGVVLNGVDDSEGGYGYGRR